jgi:hypothetical protein
MILPFEVLIGFLTSIFVLVMFFIAFIRYRTLGYRPLLYLAIQWFGLALWGIFTAISTFLLVNGDKEIIVSFRIFENFYEWTLADTLGFAGYYLTIPTLFFLLLFLDSITRTTIDPKKMVLGGIISTGLVISILAHPWQGAKNVSIYTYYAQALYYLTWIFLWFFYSLRIFLSSPQNLRRYSAFVFVGTILIATDAFLTATRINLPGSDLSILLMALGGLLIVLPFSYQPQLLYILPFKVVRLSVINENGLPLFIHSWKKDRDRADEVLFSGMMLGISTILNESLKTGNVREIVLAESKLLIITDDKYSVIFVLQCTRSSKSLHDALSLFADEFIETFEKYLSVAILNPKDVDATEIVDKCFPFLPEYD